MCIFDFRRTSHQVDYVLRLLDFLLLHFERILPAYLLCSDTYKSRRPILHNITHWATPFEFRVEDWCIFERKKEEEEEDTL